MTQRIINIDSQVLNSIQNCARKTQLQFIEHLQPQTKAEPLEKGSQKALRCCNGGLSTSTPQTLTWMTTTGVHSVRQSLTARHPYSNDLYN